MCSRFAYLGLSEAIASELDMPDLPEVESRYNIAPTDPVPTVRINSSGKKEFAILKWGLIPSWSRTPKVSFATINAKSEEIEQKPSFREAFAQGRRCLILTDGFFEWLDAPGGKQPYFFRMKSRKTFCMAGLWETWKGGSETVESCTILTVPANDLVARVHAKKRMPALFSDRDPMNEWIHFETGSVRAHELLTPYPEALMESYPVTKKMGNVRYALADSIVPMEG